VKDVTNCPCVQRELLLIRVRAFPSTRSQILEIAQIFRCKIVDISDTTITLEITGDPGKTNVIQQLLNTYTILQIVRTGKIIMERYDGINTEYLKTI
jgi:acetolactate synthase-1/3 small subunit